MGTTGLKSTAIAINPAAQGYLPIRHAPRDKQEGARANHKFQQYLVIYRGAPYHRREQRRNGNPFHDFRKHWNARFFFLWFLLFRTRERAVLAALTPRRLGGFRLPRRERRSYGRSSWKPHRFEAEE